MNLANKLTVFRVVLVPFFVAFMLLEGIVYNTLIAMVIFIVATATDKLDGIIARKYNMVTSFGKFMDPIADKLLVCSALVCLTSSGKIPAWIVITIIAREFIISGIRIIAAENGVVIAASQWGKIKTIIQMAMIIIILAEISFPSLSLGLLSSISMYAALALTVISAADYLIKNKNALKMQDGKDKGKNN